MIPSESKSIASVVLAQLVRNFICLKRLTPQEQSELRGLVEKRKKVDMRTKSEMDNRNKQRCWHHLCTSFLAAVCKRDQIAMASIWQWIESADAILSLMYTLKHNEFANSFFDTMIRSI